MRSTIRAFSNSATAANTPSSSLPVAPLKGKIAFSSDRDGDREIYVMDDDGGNVKALTDKDKEDGGADWSSK